MDAQWTARELSVLCAEYERLTRAREVVAAAHATRSLASGLRADLAALLESGEGADVLLEYGG